MGHCTMGGADDGVASGEIADCGHCGCKLLAIGVTNHRTEDNVIIDDGQLNRQSNRITFIFLHRD